jgi:deoxyribodipyrimidine photo-lyase
MASEELLSGEADALARLPIDHSVKPVGLRGGQQAAGWHIKEFLSKRLPLYAEERNEPDKDVASGLPPYLHFGHISVHEIFAELAKREKWKPEKAAVRANGSKQGWWNMSAPAESFIDELIAWRETGVAAGMGEGGAEETREGRTRICIRPRRI